MYTVYSIYTNKWSIQIFSFSIMIIIHCRVSINPTVNSVHLNQLASNEKKEWDFIEYNTKTLHTQCFIHFFSFLFKLPVFNVLFLFASQNDCCKIWCLNRKSPWSCYKKQKISQIIFVSAQWKITVLISCFHRNDRNKLQASLEECYFFCFFSSLFIEQIAIQYIIMIVFIRFVLHLFQHGL